MDCSPSSSSVHGDSPGKNTGVDCCALLQWISPTQGSNPCFLHCRQILYRLSHQGSLLLKKKIRATETQVSWQIYLCGHGFAALDHLASIYFSGFILSSVLGSSTHWLPPVNFSLSYCRALAYTILLLKMFCVSPFLELFFSCLFPSDTRVAASSPSWIYWWGNIGQGEKWSLPITYSSVRYWVGQKVHLGFSCYWKL